MIKKIISILVFGLLLGSEAIAKEINLICKSNEIEGGYKNVPASYFINTKTKKAIWQNRVESTYFIDGSILKHIYMYGENKKTWHRHSLNRNTGLLTIEIYEFKEEKKENEMRAIIDKKVALENKEGDNPFLFKTIFQVLETYKSIYRVNFNCEKNKKLF